MTLASLVPCQGTVCLLNPLQLTYPVCLCPSLHPPPPAHCQAAASLAGSFLPAFLRKQLLNIVMRPFADPGSSLKEDIWLLRHSPLMPPHIPIHGLVSALSLTVLPQRSVPQHWASVTPCQCSSDSSSQV